MSQRSQSGFTLMELVVVTVLIGLVFALGAAQLDWVIPKYKLRGVGREMGSIMKEARSKALGTGKDVYVVYDIADDRWWILVAQTATEEEEEPDPDTPPPAIPKGFEYERVRERKLPADIHIKSVVMGRSNIVEGGQALARFSPFGMSEHHIVNLYDESGRELAVKFNGFTGHLKFYSEHKGPEDVLEDDDF